MLTSLIGVIILLGGLIFFHELGHYSVAKFFGIKVEVFSLGFGKKIFSKVWGETEYCLSIFPLGGYVKLMGDDPYKGVPPDQAERAFCTQALYKRFAVVAAGPIANLLLAYTLFMIVFWVGQPTVGNRVGQVAYNSAAWQAGFRAKDRIVSVDGRKVSTWNEFEDALKGKEGQKAEVEIERAAAPLKLSVPVTSVRGKNVYGEDQMQGGIKGIQPNPLAPVVGISDPLSPAYQSGIRTGDLISKIGSRSVETFDDIAEALSDPATAESGKPVTVTLKRTPEGSKQEVEQSVSLLLPKNLSVVSLTDLGKTLGVYPAETFVRQVSKDSPAEKGGLKAEDRIVQIGETPIYYFDSIVELVQENGTKGVPIVMQLERQGKIVTLNLQPIESVQEDPITRATYKKFLVGFSPHLVLKEPDYALIQVRDFPGIIVKAVTETNVMAKRMVVSLWKLAFGQISVKNLGGPILIATVAGRSLDAGIIPFLQMMALISINLFLLNLFPVPVLDGGHLLFFSLEAIKGKPVSIRTMEIANQIGMVFILLLVVLTLFNDISRIVLH